MDLKNLFGYEGKTVVVSGAYSSMGLAASRLLHELGASVYTICRRNGRHSNLTFFPLYYTTKSRHPHFCECLLSFYWCKALSCLPLFYHFTEKNPYGLFSYPFY